MDFMKLLKSLEELLYELVCWLLFYPLTLWRALRHPLKMMSYADDELLDGEESQYTDSINPPLFLFITLMLAYWIELKLVKSSLVTLPPVLSEPSNLLIFRGIIYSIFPFIMSLKIMLHQKVPLDRRTLKPPFYAQCYVAAPFAFAVSMASILTRIKTDESIIAGLTLFVLALAWYFVIQTRWLRIYSTYALWRAILSVFLSIVQGCLIIYAVVTVLSL